jgi:hypothetical protein
LLPDGHSRGHLGDLLQLWKVPEKKVTNLRQPSFQVIIKR